MKKTKFPQKPREELSNKCPKCEYLQLCPCSTCTKSRKSKNKNQDIKPYIWIDGEYIKCAKCGHTGHASYWEDWEYNCIIEKHGSLTAYIDAMREKAKNDNKNNR